MTFLNPLLLLGLAAAAIPVLLHLFQQRAPRTVPFPNVALLKALQTQTVRRSRLRDGLLLLLRVLALVALALAFARPRLDNALAGLGGKPASVVVVVDNSLSASRAQPGGTPLDRAKTTADALLDALAPSDEVFVLPVALPSGTPPSASSTPEAARDAVAALKPAHNAAPLTHALERAAALLDGARYAAKEVYVLSDLQTSTLVDSSAGRIPLDDGRVVLLGTNGDAPTSNLAVTAAQVTTRTLELGQPIDVQAVVQDFGDGLPATAPLSLREGGTRLAEGSASLRAGQPSGVRLRFTPTRRGWLGLTVEAPADDFPYDDRRYLAVRIPGSRRLARVGLASRYLDGVLQPGLTPGSSPFAVDDLPASALTPERLAAYDAVLVGPASPLAPSSVEALGRYVRDGGGVFVFAGDNASALNPLLASLGGGAFGAVSTRSPATKLGRIDASHPVFSGVFIPQPGQPPAEDADVRRIAAYRPGGGAERTLVALVDGSPLVQELRVGQGRALVVAVPPDPSWSDLPVRGLFVPLVLRGTLLLAHRDAALGAEAGVGGSVAVPGRFATPLTQIDADEVRTTPTQRVSGGQTVVTLGDAPPGLYRLVSGDSLVAMVAVNPDARESDLTAAPLNEATSRLREATGLNVEAMPALRTDAIQQGRTASSGRELWPLLLTLAFALLVTESVVARRLRRPAA
ncbi:MAG: BatA domain-containing protein [Rhodothermales bacterium]|nr:BatA domain-containing protein [Rhodothermales bacterium]